MCTMTSTLLTGGLLAPASQKALVVTWSKTVWNSPVCAGRKKALRLFSIYALYVSMTTGMDTNAFTGRASISDFMAPSLLHRR